MRQVGILQDEIADLSSEIVNAHKTTPARRALLVGVSGIDGSGKGYVSSKLAQELRSARVNVAIINADGWLNLPGVRFSTNDPGRHFYENAFRFDEMFGRLVLPLKRDGSVDVTADLVEETAKDFRQHRYIFDNIDVILLEGIFLFRKQFAGHFDLRIWIECSQEVALVRAIKRSQEGLSPIETTHVYNNIYFPAQRIHSIADQPTSAAHFIFTNDQNN